ncbi:uncharacterized protein LOC109720716 [Ananas comosus]|uniref:Uncharacterized protein LOC109720716 n=1 Tax=Ananas comosus TaxID=4615 RepID=A0A6P5GDX4_ANACO|nr:uncharacterized protein LOC109720716 [Ananas comosus]
MRMDREEVPDAAAGKGGGGGGGGGKRGVQKLFKAAFKRGDASAARVTAWGGGDESESARSGSSSGSGSGSGSSSSGAARRHRRASHDDDRSSERHSGELEGSNGSKLLLALRNAKIQYANEPYPWERKMRELLPLPSSSSFLSLLLLPKASDPSASHYNSLEDTLARADTWLTASQASGVPIMFMNVQTEALLTKISGETASSTVNMGSPADMANMANVSLYGFEDYHGVDIGVVRAVRLWYTPVAGETELEITLQQGDTRLGFAISRTDEGFIYVSSVAEEEAAAAASSGTAAARSGLRELFREARGASKLLVISRVGGAKVLPWMVSTCGAVKCFDTVSLSQKLSLHLHALLPIRLHFLLWAPPPPEHPVNRDELELSSGCAAPLGPPAAPAASLLSGGGEGVRVRVRVRVGLGAGLGGGRVVQVPEHLAPG